ncbi:urease [Gigaspora margarita]|uniref:Urease n=1 Tax=Gigaspora margarita TaxID=4874 RepID=A0A8H3ZZH3_GIGMA|nr:urease [Gigaspora margarita]
MQILWSEIEKDYTVYGDKCKFGGGKVLRKGIDQSTSVTDTDALDLANIGVKGSHIAGIGKASNPDVMDGVTPDQCLK